MSLISCPGCSKKVSDSTISCPDCGYGIASAREDNAAGVPLAAIEQTNKKFMLHYIISILLFIAGVVWIFDLVSSKEASGKQELIAPVVMTVGGLIWAIVTKVSNLWNP